MNNKHIYLCVIFAVILVACAPGAPVQTPTLHPASSSTPSPSNTPALTPSPTITPEPVPDVVLLVGQTLARQLNLQPTQVAIASLENETWDDDCLGIILEGTTCHAIKTRGYIVAFQAGDEQYIYHINETGSRVRLALAPSPQVGSPIIRWQFTDTYCQTVLIGDKGVAFGECNAPMLNVQLSSQNRKADLEYLKEAFYPFQADTPAGSIVFTGLGSLKPTSAEKRMVAEWARLVYQESRAGHSSATYGLSLVWHREGGFAGYCDDISVYLTGEINATSCKSGTTTGLGRSRLDAAQLAQVYAWVDEFESFEVSNLDGEGLTDSMTNYLAFTGMGEAQPTEYDKQTILKFAADLYTGFTPAGAITDIDLARQALIEFFQLLHDGDYRKATDLFGGSYEILIDMNPDIPSHDFAGLLENGCENNGFQCKQVGEVIAEEQILPEEFHFTIEFINDDGSLFTLGSCCGEEATVDPIRSRFEFTVIKDGEVFLVQELPQYNP
ncbi:MAG: hypothetical protein JW908_10995 [Anaerolineales bacterium]|nr:hypothetical protein [Anaerolineales bacterium]